MTRSKERSQEQEEEGRKIKIKKGMPRRRENKVRRRRSKKGKQKEKKNKKNEKRNNNKKKEKLWKSTWSGHHLAPEFPFLMLFHFFWLKLGSFCFGLRAFC